MAVVLVFEADNVFEFLQNSAHFPDFSSLLLAAVSPAYPSYLTCHSCLLLVLQQ